MKKRRRLILTMTPLLDLMLMVIFAQYMDLQNAAAEERSERLRAQQAKSDMETTRREAFDSMEKLNQKLSDVQGQNEQLRVQLASSEKKHEQEMSQEKRRAAEQLRAVGKVFQDVLHLPPDAVKKALRGASPEEIESVLREITAVRQQSLAGIVQHLRETVEFHKRWDVWEVHIRKNGSVRIKVRGKVIREELFPAGRDSFFVQVEPLMKGLEEPKSFVLVLISYADVTRKAREDVAEGLQLVKEKLRHHWSQEKQIYITELGFTPQAP